MITTSDGGYIMVGETLYTDTNFTVHHGSFMDADIGVLKLDSLGKKVWSQTIGGTGDERCWAVVAGSNNSCYIIGSTPSDDFDCTGNHGGTSGSSDVYLARLDMNGDLLWHKDLWGTGDDGGKCGWQDGNGGVIIGGSTNSHDGEVTHYVGGVLVLDVDSSGNIAWNSSYGNASNESPNAICKAMDGSIWIAGESGPKGGQIDTAYGNTDAWFVHTDNAGNFINAKVLGSRQQDEGYMIYPLSNGNIIAGGYYDTAGGAFPIISWGSGDAFIAIFAPWPENVQQINATHDPFRIYPNPANQFVNVENLQKNNYYLTVSDVFGRTVYTTNH